MCMAFTLMKQSIKQASKQAINPPINHISYDVLVYHNRPGWTGVLPCTCCKSLCYGLVCYRADVYDRMTIFEDHIVRDINAGRFSNNTNLVLVSHGLALRIFLMRWFHWSVDEFMNVYNPPNCAVSPLCTREAWCHSLLLFCSSGLSCMRCCQPFSISMHWAVSMKHFCHRQCLSPADSASLSSDRLGYRLSIGFTCDM